VEESIVLTSDKVNWNKEADCDCKRVTSCFDGGIHLITVVVLLVWEHDERRRLVIWGSSFSSIERLSLVDGGTGFGEGVASDDVDGGWTFSTLSVASFKVAGSWAKERYIVMICESRHRERINH
jgi:hypothetical protein